MIQIEPRIQNLLGEAQLHSIEMFNDKWLSEETSEYKARWSRRDKEGFCFFYMKIIQQKTKYVIRLEIIEAICNTSLKKIIVFGPYRFLLYISKLKIGIVAAFTWKLEQQRRASERLF